MMATEIAALERLSQQCSDAAQQGEADDAAFEDPPEEFVDPVMDTLMMVNPWASAPSRSSISGPSGLLYVSSLDSLDL